MSQPIDIGLTQIRELILSMGGLVEKALDETLQGLLKRDTTSIHRVREIEEKINEDHVKIDEACVQFLARRGPVAHDLRWAVSIIKINSDLERMGDQAINIALITKDYLKRSSSIDLTVIQHMSTIVKGMIREALDSVVQENLELAKKVLLRDDEVDEMKANVLATYSQKIKQDSQNVEIYLDVIAMARNLERLGDHATNIAEDVIYVSTGKDIRHGGKYSG